MSLITTTNLAKSYGANDIFAGLSLSIPRRARIAVVGPNGIGKTTLLRVLVGLEEPSAGVVHRARRLKIGYLPQEAAMNGEHTLWEECMSAFKALCAQEAELARLEVAMGDPEQAQEAMARYGPLQEDFERRGGYTYELRTQQTLTGLGFEATDAQRPLNQLSGGQRTRALLARLLLSEPDLLVLDEPTNHLDIAAVEWLEGVLSHWEGAALIVSHDRYFLDHVVDHIWEMSTSGMEAYRGNYSAYLRQRQERWELRQQTFEAEKERLEKELDYIRRNIAGQNTLQAKGRLRRLSRYLEAIEIGGLQAIQDKKWSEISEETGATAQMMSVDEVTRRVHGLRSPIRRQPPLRLHLKPAHRSGDLVLRTYDLAVGYADEGKPLFHAPDLTLRRGECAAIIGPNGAGKTTFLKTLLGKIPPFQGELLLGASLEVGYFAQAHEDLNPFLTLIEEIESVAPHLLAAEIRDYLARFLFTEDDVYKRVSTLSGGERGRLALAKLSLSQANLLLLDEPTNHLDIPSQEQLQEVLSEYPGTILLVSHDRYLIDALATQIWEIEQANLRIFAGGYSAYRAYLETQKAEQASQTKAPAPASTQRPARLSVEEKHRRNRLADVEKRIASLEEQIGHIATLLEKPPPESETVQRLGEDYVELQ
ncbi:MAG: ABC-F family ATP-binding cassette domain-containing protein, partial [Anaerolineales bacterium]|nr:ABC-F family ATP-binding cassette domain-containing protein [Anaerolineales bacterium]